MDEPRIIMACEITRSEKDKYTNSLTCRIKKQNKQNRKKEKVLDDTISITYQ